MRACVQKCKIETDIHKETIRMTTINKISCVHLHSQHLSPKEKKEKKSDGVHRHRGEGEQLRSEDQCKFNLCIKDRTR